MSIEDPIDTSTPELPVTMSDIERIEKQAQDPEAVDEDNAEYLRELITTDAFDAATDVRSLVSDVEGRIDDDRVPDDVQRDVEGYLYEIEKALDMVVDHTRDDFKNENAKENVEALFAKERMFKELKTLARDQQHALQQYRDRIDVLGPRVVSLSRKCETLEGRVERMKAEVEALEPLM